jgi:hypothetical protein
MLVRYVEHSRRLKERPPFWVAASRVRPRARRLGEQGLQ